MREKEKSFLSVPSQYKVGNSKKIAKNSKNQKTSLWLLLNLKRDGTGWDWEKKNSSLRSIHSRPGVGISKKIAKKLKKLENINMASSQAKTGTGEAENMEKKNSRSDPFQPNPE